MAISDWMHSYAYVLMYKDHDDEWLEFDISFSEEYLEEVAETKMRDTYWFGYKIIRVPFKYLTPAGDYEDDREAATA